MSKSKKMVIEKMIYIIREQKVMLDSDLAELYEVDTKVLNQAVKRNIARFPQDFIFQLTTKECDSLRSQFDLKSFLMLEKELSDRVTKLEQ